MKLAQVTKFHRNLTHSLIGDSRSDMDWQRDMWSAHKTFFFICLKNTKNEYQLIYVCKALKASAPFHSHNGADFIFQHFSTNTEVHGFFTWLWYPFSNFNCLQVVTELFYIVADLILLWHSLQSSKIVTLLEESRLFAWHLVDATAYEQVVNWFVMSCDPRVILGTDAASGVDNSEKADGISPIDYAVLE